jgi:hypothetical protein
VGSMGISTGREAIRPESTTGSPLEGAFPHRRHSRAHEHIYDPALCTPEGDCGYAREGELLPPPFGVEERDRGWAEAPALDPPGTTALLLNAVHFAFG